MRMLRGCPTFGSRGYLLLLCPLYPSRFSYCPGLVYVLCLHADGHCRHHLGGGSLYSGRSIQFRGPNPLNSFLLGYLDHLKYLFQVVGWPFPIPVHPYQGDSAPSHCHRQFLLEGRISRSTGHYAYSSRLGLAFWPHAPLLCL